MLKGFCKFVKTLVPASLAISTTHLVAANFSVDNSNASGIGSFAEIIKSSNAIYPGSGNYNSIYFRSNLTLNESYPEIRNNLSFNVVDSYFVTVASAIKSSGNFQKQGQGTIEIKAPFNFQGDWLILEGTVIKSDAQPIAGKYLVSGSLKSNGALLGKNDIQLSSGKLAFSANSILDNLITVNKSGSVDTGTFNAELKNLKGSGLFNKLGTGYLLVSSNSDFVGKYSIQQGTLQLNDISFSGQIALEGGNLKISSNKSIENAELLLSKGRIILNTPKLTLSKAVKAQGSEAVFDLNGANLSMPSGLSGFGIVDFIGPGILDMGAKDPFCGHVKLENLTFNPSNFSKNTIYKLNNATLNLSSISEIDFTTRFLISSGQSSLLYQDNPLVLNSSFEGKGTIKAYGHGQMTVRSLASFQGDWIQQKGHLHLEGSLYNLNVEKDATITGYGLLNDFKLNGQFIPTINALNSQNTITAKTADLAGKIVIRPEVGVYKKGNYKILNASNVNLSNMELLAPAQFDGKLAKTSEGLAFDIENFYLLADLVNKKNIDDFSVASSFDKYYALPGTDRDNILRKLLSLKDEPEKFNAAFQGLQPAYFSALGLTQEYNFILARSTLSNRMEELLLFPCAQSYIWDEPLAVWLDPVGDFTMQEPRQQDMGYHAATVGGFFGFDGKIGSSLRLGLLSGYTNSRVRWMEEAGKGIINSEYLAGYFLYKPSQFYLNGSLSGSYSHYSAARNINIVDIHRQARHKNHGFGYEADFEFGYIFKGKTYLQPYIRQSYIGLYQQKFKEYGADSLDLNVDSKKFAMYRIDAGFIFSRCLNYKNLAITPEISLSGIWEQELKTGTFQATYQDTGQSYEVVGMKPRRLLISPGAALDFVIKKYPIMIGARYHGEFSSQFNDQRISGHLGYGF